MTRPTLALAIIALLALAGCGGPEGTVHTKREHGVVKVRELCIGDSPTACTWTTLRGKNAYDWYRRCDVGDRWPDCRSIF